MLGYSLSLITAAAVVLAAPEPPRAGAGNDPVLEDCGIASVQNQPVPSSDSGMLVEVLVKELDYVTKGTELARVDTREAAAAKTVKELEFKVADQKAKSDINVRHSVAARDVAKKYYEKLNLVNEQMKKTITEVDLLKAWLELQKSELTIEKSKEESESDRLTAQAKQAEVDAADVALNRRTLTAPFDGVVSKVYKHEGQWVSPGDSVVDLVNTDRLRVTGNVDATKWVPSELENRKVTVEVELPRGRAIQIEGQVVYVSPLVYGTEMEVWAEIDAPIEKGRALVRDGMVAKKMTIHVSQPAVKESRSATRSKTPVKG